MQKQSSSVIDSQVPDDLLYSEDHYWIRLEDGDVIFGLTYHVQQDLGDAVFIELPEQGMAFDARDEAGSIEFMKTSTDIQVPLSGRVTEVNSRLERRPSLLSRDPYGLGWIARIRMSDPTELDELMPPEEYSQVAEGGE